MITLTAVCQTRFPKATRLVVFCASRCVKGDTRYPPRLSCDVKYPFIRAPYIKAVSGDAEILARVGGKIAAARQGSQLVTAFHPELNDSLEVHRCFLNICS